jgi:hypothetical protein
MIGISRTIVHSHFTPYVLVAVLLALCGSIRIPAQETGPGPLTAPPEHNVKRVVGVPEPEAPPSLPPAQIIKGFTQKEDIYFNARPQYSYRKTIRIQEFGPDGKLSGEYLATYEAGRTSDGKIYERALAAPQSTLEYLQFEPDDVQQLFRLPAYPLVTSQLPKYVLQYLGTETVDEVDCYIFQVHPKTLERQHPYFDGVVWVDQKYLEVVKTYGKWVTDLGEIHPSSLPFAMFETYRENVDGKYWFPDYSRADDVVKLKDHNVPVRVTIKWSDFKPFPATQTQTAPAPAAAPPAPNPPSPAKP